MRSSFRTGLVARLAVVSAVTATTTLGAVVTTSTTAAAAENCTHHGFISYADGKVTATAFESCWIGGELIISDDNVDILRLNPNTGRWKPVVNTVGTGTYVCKNTATHSYRLDNGYVDKELDDAPCG
jgi:hypothetical protein